jgi:UDP-glucose:(heptosyl)LPS alpha-1,3-glucosyltransferase
MKVALIIERAKIDLGGAERSLFELSSALRSAGCQVEILAAKGGTKVKNIHLLCSDLPGKRTPFNEFEKALKKYLSENYFDIIHSFLPFDFADIYQPRGGSYPETTARNIASYSNRFIRQFKNATAFLNFQRSELSRAEARICSNPSGSIIAALSDYVVMQFKNHYSLYDDRIALIRNGVLTDKTVDNRETDKVRADVLRKLELTEANQPVFFLFVANNFRLKGLDVLIKAMQMAAGSSNRTAYLLVVGNGNPKKYKRLAVKLNIDQKILFLGPVRKINTILSVCDVAVLPTFYDPSSRFILEALASDKPVITTRFNGATDLFTNNRHGKIIDIPENIPALAEAISYFTETKNINKAAAAIIKDNLREQISISRVARELISLYHSIIEQRTGESN